MFILSCSSVLAQSNGSGQIGDGTTNDRYSPVKIMKDVSFVSTGADVTMAIRTDGTLWSWGANRNGQLGDGRNENRLNPIKVLDGVVAISAREFHALAIRENGTVWTWGSNDAGQLGNGERVRTQAGARPPASPPKQVLSNALMNR